MKNFKLILKSLISNNACVEGGRKKPWYFAAIMFFLAMIFAVLPLFVQTWNTNGDDVFKTNAYGLDQAAYRFIDDKLDKEGLKIYVRANGDKKEIVCEKADGAQVRDVDYTHTIPVKASDGTYTEQPDYIFHYRAVYNEGELSTLLGDEKTSMVFIYDTKVLIHVVNFETKATIKNIVCNEAPKYLKEGQSINELLSKDSDPTVRMSETFSNWKLFIRDAYNFTRLTQVWQTVAIMGGINAGITLFMGLMIWILTRGKHNPYRLFNLWETQKIAWWAAITPSILALAFGFLIQSFANILFPMVLGVRVMWLSMKSLRPDGSGYAAAD